MRSQLIKFLANENLPLASVRLLRENTIDIASITENSRGISDAEVLARAVNEKRAITLIFPWRRW